MSDLLDSVLHEWLRTLIARRHRLPGYEHERGSDEGLSLYALLRARGERHDEREQVAE